MGCIFRCNTLSFNRIDYTGSRTAPTSCDHAVGAFRIIHLFVPTAPTQSPHTEQHPLYVSQRIKTPCSPPSKRQTGSFEKPPFTPPIRGQGAQVPCGAWGGTPQNQPKTTPPSNTKNPTTIQVPHQAISTTTEAPIPPPIHRVARPRF